MALNQPNLKAYSYLLLMIVLASCQPQEDRNTNSQTTAYVPVYMSPQTINDIAVQPAKNTVHPGKIYAYGKTLFQVEQNEGLHIIDNTDPRQAHKIAFLKVPLCTEVSVKGGYLYTNNQSDLVVFDISNLSAPKLVNRLPNAFPPVNQAYPPFTNVYFVCPDPSKGIVVDWVRTTVKEAKCRR